MSYICGYCDDEFSADVMCPECVAAERAAQSETMHALNRERLAHDATQRALHAAQAEMEAAREEQREACAVLVEAERIECRRYGLSDPGENAYDNAIDAIRATPLGTAPRPRWHAATREAGPETAGPYYTACNLQSHAHGPCDLPVAHSGMHARHGHAFGGEPSGAPPAALLAVFDEARAALRCSEVRVPQGAQTDVTDYGCRIETPLDLCAVCALLARAAAVRGGR